MVAPCTFGVLVADCQCSACSMCNVCHDMWYASLTNDSCEGVARQRAVGTRAERAGTGPKPYGVGAPCRPPGAVPPPGRGGDAGPQRTRTGLRARVACSRRHRSAVSQRWRSAADCCACRAACSGTQPCAWPCQPQRCCSIHARGASRVCVGVGLCGAGWGRGRHAPAAHCVAGRVLANGLGGACSGVSPASLDRALCLALACHARLAPCVSAQRALACASHPRAEGQCGSYCAAVLLVAQAQVIRVVAPRRHCMIENWPE